MDYHEVMTKYFSKILKSEYDIDESDLLFKPINNKKINVFFKGGLILIIDYFVIEDFGERISVDIKIENYATSYISEMNYIFIPKCYNESSLFKEHIIKMLDALKFTINKETTVVNNAQEIIEITKKAKEENIKKDIENLESKILEAARKGKEIVMLRLSKLKTNLSLMNKSDNEIVNHFRNKGFECSISERNHYMSEKYLVIKWGD